jgi:hypothetical protein
VESARLSVSAAALDWLEGNQAEHYFQHQTFVLRELERNLSDASVERTPEDVALLLALCFCLVGTGRLDARAEGMYILTAMLSGTGNKRASRLLKWSLAREPEWSLIRLFIPEPDGSGSQVWPGRFPGLEAALILSDSVAPQEALAFVGPDVRMRLDKRSHMDLRDLPLKYRIELDLHWLRMLVSQVSNAGAEQGELNSFGARRKMQMIDVESMHRNLNTLLAQEFETLSSTDIEDLLDQILHAERDGAPLTSFSEFFVDHLLPILALGILVGRQPEEFKVLGERCCPIFASYTRQDPRELKAFCVYWASCLQWRQAHGPDLANHLLRRTSTNGFQANIRGIF